MAELILASHHLLDDSFEAAVQANDFAAQAECYFEAGQDFERDGDIDAACFNYTHAYVLALDSGHKKIAQAALKALQKYGRE